MENILLNTPQKHNRALRVRKQKQRFGTPPQHSSTDSGLQAALARSVTASYKITILQPLGCPKIKVFALKTISVFFLRIYMSPPSPTGNKIVY